MFVDLFPRAHARFMALPLLGPHLEAFIAWLAAEGFPELPIRLRVREMPRLEERLRRRGIRRLEDLTAERLRAFAPRDSQQDIPLTATVRSLASFLTERKLLVPAAVTLTGQLVGDYRSYLRRLRGFATSTLRGHCATALELLAFVGFDDDPSAVRKLDHRMIEAFVTTTGGRVSRASLQHTVGQLRSFIRYLASRGEIARGLDAIDTPRLYRGEQLPRALPWETVRAFLAAIDRSTPMGQRDYAMFMLIATYGLRTSEIAALRLDDIDWRAERIRVPRPKVSVPLVLPLTVEVGEAVLDYVRHARPPLSCRELFLRVRAPAGRIKPTAVTEAFQGWTRRNSLPIRQQGPHCLRHSLAVHLLREGASLKVIGDLLGIAAWRARASTCVSTSPTCATQR